MPSPIRRRLEALRRDVATVLADLRGDHPSPLIPRRASAPRRTVTSATAATARPLIVRAVRRETADATTVVLGDPSGASIRFVPGQFLTLLVTIDGEQHRRAYSICSPPGGEDGDATQVAITAKRIAGGRVSTHIHERVSAGDVIPVLGPSGEFTVVPDADARRNLVLVAGGSGITPILAILRAVLAQEPHTRATLIYGNRRAEDVIHARAIDALAAAHDRFTVRHVLEERGDGRLDRATVGALLDDLAPAPDTDYFICGPTAAMVAVKDELVARGVPSARLHEERFATPERKPLLRAAQRVTIRRGAKVSDVLVAPDATLLDAGLAAGVDMPFSCTMGGCGACAVDLADGDVDHDEPNCLTSDERSRGRVLACVARPNGPCTVVVP
jgi:ring-1,2-phenylacetyl-CoA epoxidase subunit PaaE